METEPQSSEAGAPAPSPAPTLQPPSKPTNLDVPSPLASKMLLFGLPVLCVGLVILMAVSKDYNDKNPVSSSSSTDDPRWEAQVMCAEFSRKNYGIEPNSQERRSSEVTLTSDGAFVRMVFSAQGRLQTVNCTMQKRPNGGWVALAMQRN